MLTDKISLSLTGKVYLVFKTCLATFSKGWLFAGKPPAKQIFFEMASNKGVAACEKIKSVSHLKDIPLIAVTEIVNMEKMRLTFEVGVSDCISKPLENKIELIPRKKRLLPF